MDLLDILLAIKVNVYLSKGEKEVDSRIGLSNFDLSFDVMNHFKCTSISQ